MLPYGRQSISPADLAAVANVLGGDWLTTGPSVVEFEEMISKVAGGPRAVTVSSGTAALHTAYVAAGLQPGDEVITTPMTFVATASMASLVGAKVKFADVSRDTGLVDPRSVEECLSPRTKIIAAVDYAGQPADYARLQTLADRVGALTLDDAAHSIGTTFEGRPVGSLSDITTFSFFPTKNITTGEGGAVVSASDHVIERAREFARLGLVRDPGRFRIQGEGAWHQEVHAFGVNYRLTDIACALGRSQLLRLDSFKARRADVVSQYEEALADLDGVSTVKRVEGADPMWHFYPILVSDGRRREVFEKMRASGIGVQVNYIPVYWHPAYADLGYVQGQCPEAELFYQQELSLPVFADITDAQVEQVIASLEDALR